jgi:hypothetical protein
MRAVRTQKAVAALGIVVLVVAAFLTTLKVLDYLKGNVIQINEPTYNAASLPHVSSGQILDFSNGQNRSALLSGWSNAEPLAVWSEGHNAFMGFVVNIGAGTNAPKYATVRAMPYLVPGKLDAQRVEIWSGGKKLAEYDLKNQDSVFKVPLDSISISDGTPVIFGLYLPDASVPAKIETNHGDPRMLGLYLKSLQLMQ